MRERKTCRTISPGPGKRRSAGRRLLVFLAWLGLLAGLAVACAPSFVPPGPVVCAPTLTGEALITADNCRLPLRAWLPATAPGAVLVALHGFNDYSNFINAAAMVFAERGLAVYSYDQRGFGNAPNRGRWPGARAFAEDLKAMTGLVRARHPGVPLYLLGESMGGAVILAAMAGSDPPAADGVILLAPAVWTRSAMPLYQRAAHWLTVHTVPGWQPTGQSLGIRPSDNREMLRALGRDPLVIKKTRIDTAYGLVDLMDEAYLKADRLRGRVLYLYGQKDELIPSRPTRAVMARLAARDPGLARFVIYENGYHMLLRDRQGRVVLDDILAWLADPDQPLPSVAAGQAAEVHGRGSAGLARSGS